MGIHIAFDVGTVRIGVATSDAGGVLASPQEAIPAGEESIARASQLVEDYSASAVIVGLPRTLKGGESHSTELARTWACELEKAVSTPVILVDERLTTVQAQNSFKRAGQNIKKTRSKIDSAAAAVLLQGYLESMVR